VRPHNADGLAVQHVIVELLTSVVGCRLAKRGSVFHPTEILGDIPGCCPCSPFMPTHTSVCVRACACVCACVCVCVCTMYLKCVCVRVHYVSRCCSPHTYPSMQPPGCCPLHVSFTLTCTCVQGIVVVDIRVAQGAAGHGITAHTDGGNWSNLQGRREGGGWEFSPATLGRGGAPVRFGGDTIRVRVPLCAHRPTWLKSS